MCIHTCTVEILDIVCSIIEEEDALSRNVDSFRCIPLQDAFHGPLFEFVVLPHKVENGGDQGHTHVLRTLPHLIGFLSRTELRLTIAMRLGADQQVW